METRGVPGRFAYRERSLATYCAQTHRDRELVIAVHGGEPRVRGRARHAGRVAPIRYPKSGYEARSGEDLAVALQLKQQGAVHLLADAPHRYVYVSHGANLRGDESRRLQRQADAARSADSRGPRRVRFRAARLNGARVQRARVHDR